MDPGAPQPDVSCCVTSSSTDCASAPCSSMAPAPYPRLRPTEPISMPCVAGFAKAFRGEHKAGHSPCPDRSRRRGDRRLLSDGRFRTGCNRLHCFNNFSARSAS